MQEFIGYLFKGVSAVALVLSSMTFDIYNTTVSLTDLLVYSGCISFTLKLIDKLGSSSLLSKNHAKMKGEGRK